MINRIKTKVFTALIYVCFRVKVYGDPGRRKNPVQGIYICNHMAHYDGFLMQVVLRKANLYSIINREWYDKKWVRSLLLYEKCIPIDKDNPGTGWLKDARAAVRDGASINIFPEGHTSKGEMDIFRPGFLLLALMTGLPIIPVATAGRYSFFFGPRKRVVIGEPVYLEKGQLGKDAESQAKMAAQFRSMIEKMKKELESE